MTINCSSNQFFGKAEAAISAYYYDGYISLGDPDLSENCFCAGPFVPAEGLAWFTPGAEKRSTRLAPPDYAPVPGRCSSGSSWTWNLSDHYLCRGQDKIRAVEHSGTDTAKAALCFAVKFCNSPRNTSSPSRNLFFAASDSSAKFLTRFS